MNPELQWKIDNLPDSPGCYLMKHEGEIIYVGKAKNLKNRVRQYFQSAKNHTPKVQAMVDRVDDFEILLVSNELEAFTLECNLIKRHMPFYNILLKDDKHYPYIRINLKESFPRPELVRKQANDGARYFGPYIGATVVQEALDVVRIVFPIRSCAHSLPTGRPLRPCVHAQIGQCLAPCAGSVTEEAYHEMIDRVIDFLSGHYEPVLSRLTEEMRAASAAMNYERAALFRDRIRAVEQLMEKQRAIVTSGTDQDIFAIAPEDADAIVQSLYVRSGRLVGGDHFVLLRAADEDPSEALCQFLLQFYGEERAPARELLLSTEIAEAETMETLLSEIRGTKVRITVPKRGERKQLVALARKNLADEAEKRRKKRINSQEHTLGALDELKDALMLAERPLRIEGYDISNTQGALSVGSMVVMLNGVCAKNQYRQFRIRTVEGANDFASMREVIARRLNHGLAEQQERVEHPDADIPQKFGSFPDLILIDGGRGQLNAALSAMEETGLSIPMFGLEKRIEEIVLPGEADSIVLDRHSPALRLLQQLRDEAHRFAISRHRTLRVKQSVSSQLETIPFVGPSRRHALIDQFSTLEELKNASVDDLAKVRGISRILAQTIYEHFHPEIQKKDGQE